MLGNLDEIGEEDPSSQDLGSTLKSVRRLSCFADICPIKAECDEVDTTDNFEGAIKGSNLPKVYGYSLSFFCSKEPPVSPVKQSSCDDQTSIHSEVSETSDPAGGVKNGNHGMQATGNASATSTNVKNRQRKNLKWRKVVQSGDKPMRV